jgi:hypothetical protein
MEQTTIRAFARNVLNKVAFLRRREELRVLSGEIILVESVCPQQAGSNKAN